jgi:hypothetical protein
VIDWGREEGKHQIAEEHLKKNPTTQGARRDYKFGRDGHLRNAIGNLSHLWTIGLPLPRRWTKHGPHLNASYRRERDKITGTGYYVPKAAQEATRRGVAAWQEMQECLRELGKLNKERNLRRAREADSR